MNALIAYILYFLAPKKLMQNSFHGTLIQLGVRLPKNITNQIIDNLFDVYEKNKKIDKIMKRSSMTTNMERMMDLILFEAHYIKDLLNPSFVYVVHDQHEKTINILKNHNIELHNFRD